jgi:hypothetical protein
VRNLAKNLDYVQITWVSRRRFSSSKGGDTVKVAVEWRALCTAKVHPWEHC